MTELESFGKIRSLIRSEIIPGYSGMWLAAKAVEGDAPVIAKIRASLSGDELKAFEAELKKTDKGVLYTGERKFAYLLLFLLSPFSSFKKRFTAGLNTSYFFHITEPGCVIWLANGINVRTLSPEVLSSPSNPMAYPTPSSTNKEALYIRL